MHLSELKPFSLEQARDYANWRDWRLDQAPSPTLRELDDEKALPAQTIADIAADCALTGFSLFRLNPAPPSAASSLEQLGSALGLRTIDSNLCAEDSGLTEIRVKQTQTSNAYIPYTNRPLGWHTDGYYNMADQQIHAWLLYCGHPAMQGGVNGLLDHQIAYIRLRDENPEWIRALSAPEAFTIPPNVEGGEQIRPASIGPVFASSDHGKTLHMRYSARQRNVQWAQDTATQEAAQFILELLASDDPFIQHLQLQAGEGVISNNVLHNRNGFEDSPDPAKQRLILRARYYDRIAPVA